MSNEENEQSAYDTRLMENTDAHQEEAIPFVRTPQTRPLLRHAK